VTLPRHVAAAGEWPTTTEAGYPSVDISVWSGLFAIKGTPEPIYRKVIKDIGDILADPGFRERLAAVGGEIGTASGDAFVQLIADETEIVRKIVTEASIRIQ
jgi:tripartite-type tricarboxylate transporter receptor subunit TctC